MNRLSVLLLFGLGLFQISCSENKKENSQTGVSKPSSSVKEEKDYKRINAHLDNFTINLSAEDGETFRMIKKPVYAISHYQGGSAENNPRKIKKIGGKEFYLLSYTEYLKDGRKRYKEYVYDHTQRIENYHYDENFNNLILLHRIEPSTENERNYYNILNYYPDKLLKEEIGYRTYKGTDFDVMNYASYKVKKHSEAITISINHIGHDSIPSPEEIYLFKGDELTKQKPSYQSKKQYFKWISSAYKPVQTEGYVFEDRNVEFTYDKNGFVTSETWIKGGNLENKMEFEYNADYTERIEQLFQQNGKEKSTQHAKKYNSHGDLIFEQTVEYTGNLLDPVVYEYVYDENDNWIEKKKFKLNMEDGNRKELLQHELREITYFNADSKIRNIRFPLLSKKAAKVGEELTKAAHKKQRSVVQFNKAVETGRYDTQITKTEAREIKDFTPKFWKLKATAFGDLDKLPGDEAVAVYETPVPAELGFKQLLCIFKKKGNKWTPWHQSAAPILDTKGGGTIGNPFEGISIINRAIIINHFGGSRQKWSYKHTYRFQNNDWYVIGATVHFGAPCDYFLDFDYNLSTGYVAAAYKQEICNGTEKGSEKNWKENFKKAITLPKMDEFIPGDNKFDIPSFEYEIYY